MSGPIPVAVIVGSLRAASLSRKVALAMIAAAPKALACRIVEIGDLPLYNEDLDGDPPQSWTRLREENSATGAVLFVTPEYNRSIPWLPEERHRRRLAAPGQERVGRRARGRGQRHPL
jgi:chromate reductase